ncbi:MAG: DUF697 domain-containing protein [Christensenellales bacterium]
MKDDKTLILERLESVRKYYEKFEDMLDDLPFFIPKSTKKMLKKYLGQDKELEALMESISTQRPPRLLIAGDRGVGKSALVNALCRARIVETSPYGGENVDRVVNDIDIYACKRGDETEIEIFETSTYKTAEKITQIINFKPDAAILLLDSSRDVDIHSQLEFFEDLKKKIEGSGGNKLPLIVAITKVDEASDQTYEELVDEGEMGKKIALSIDIDRNQLRESLSKYRGTILAHGNVVDEIVALSSLNLYNFDELRRIIEDVMIDPNAQMGFRMTFRLSEVLSGVSNRLVKLFSGMAAVIALTPIPVADLYVLLILQGLMVALIARLSGRDVNLKTGIEFILSLGGVTLAGFGLRTVAQQAAKFANFLPFAGSAISSTIAATGTNAIGKAAVAHFISDLPLRKTKSLFKALSKSSK